MRSLLIIALCFVGTFAQAADLVEKESPYSVSETIDRLAAAVEKAGATVFARVDHAAGAQKVDMELRPTQMLMFGNPALGTPAMLEAQKTGLDLPLRVLAYETEDGKVMVTYHAPSSLSGLGLSESAEVVGKMTGALDKLTSAAVAQ